MKLAGQFAVLLCLTLAGCGNQDARSEPQINAEQAPESVVPEEPVRGAFATASEVRLFVENERDGDGEQTFTKPQGLLLTAAQRKEFESFLRVYSPDAVAACFIPHHFFRYYDATGKQVGEIAVCFCCAGVEDSGASNIRLGEDQRLTADFAALKAFVKALGERTDVDCHESEG